MDVYEPTPSEIDSSDSDMDLEAEAKAEAKQDAAGDETEGKTDKIHEEVKYIVFASSLHKLFTWCHCPSCGSVDITVSTQVIGTLLSATINCVSCDAKSKWNSQPHIGYFPAGNILLSAGILFAGATAGKVLRVLNSIGISTYCRRTFFRHQREILNPAITTVWKTQQENLLTVLEVEKRPLILGGDGRADSPGHSAKYGTYTMMELESNLVLDIQQVQVCWQNAKNCANKQLLH